MVRTDCSADPWATASSGSPRLSWGVPRSSERIWPSAVITAIRTSAAPYIQGGICSWSSAIAPASAALVARLSSDSSSAACIAIRTVTNAAAAITATESPTTIVVSSATRLASERR